MGNITTHTVSFVGGTGLGAAVLGILTAQFHMDPGLAANWLIVVAAVLGGPVLAYVAVKAKSDPALQAALDAATALAQQPPAAAPTAPATGLHPGGAPSNASVAMPAAPSDAAPPN